MKATGQEIARAKQEEPFLERFIEAYQPFILRTASQCAGFSVTRSDDEFSIALLAFYEAVRQYDPAGGSFGAFAALVIRHRLADYYRALRHFAPEIPLAPQAFDGTVDQDEADATLQMAVSQRLSRADGLQDHELLEILLFSAVPRKNTNPIAHELLSAFSTLEGVFRADMEELLSVKGVGKETAAYLKCVGALYARMNRKGE